MRVLEIFASLQGEGVNAAVRLGLRVTPRLHIVAWGNERGK